MSRIIPHTTTASTMTVPEAHKCIQDAMHSSLAVIHEDLNAENVHGIVRESRHLARLLSDQTILNRVDAILNSPRSAFMSRAARDLQESNR